MAKNLVLKLEVEPIPSQNWGVSLAHLLPKEVWDSLRREVYSIADYTCLVCGATDKRLHCHEVWVYNDKRRVQKLSKLDCECRDCHAVRHWGRTVLVSQSDPTELERLIAHFCKVNNCTREVFESHRDKVNRAVKRRSKYKYKVNFGVFKTEEVTRIWRNSRGQE